MNDMITSGSLLDRSIRGLLLRQLQHMGSGCLIIYEGETVHRLGEGTDEPCAEVRVHDVAVWRRVLFGGTVEAGKTYAEGLWSSPDPTRVLRLFARNIELMNQMDGGPLSMVMSALNRLLHWKRDNRRSTAKRNIGMHYDIGNDFYRCFLDETMMYSSAVFDKPQQSLAEAQRNKLELICQRLDLRPGEHVLEIGTGWGGFALYAAQHHGVRVTTTTISDEQHRHAQEMIDAAGLSDRITLLKQDYRDIEGQFDKFVSIEMIEAVGHRHLQGYFQRALDWLKPGGRGLVQAITIADEELERYSKEVDFIQRYIFPGGALPAVGQMISLLRAQRDDVSVELHRLGEHYAETLRRWSANLRDSRETLTSLGLDSEFYRLWQYYFHYCEAGFMEQNIDVVHLVYEKPDRS